MDGADPWDYVSTSDLHALKATWREDHAAKTAAKVAKKAAAKATSAAEQKAPDTGRSGVSRAVAPTSVSGALGSAPLFKKKKKTKKKGARKGRKGRKQRVFIKDAR